MLPPQQQPLLPLLQPQLHLLEGPPNLELTITLETLWQPLSDRQALGLHLEEEAVEAVVVEAEEDESWECFPKSSTEKETKLTHS